MDMANKAKVVKASKTVKGHGVPSKGKAQAKPKTGTTDFWPGKIMTAKQMAAASKRALVANPDTRDKKAVKALFRVNRDKAWKEGHGRTSRGAMKDGQEHAVLSLGNRWQKGEAIALICNTVQFFGWGDLHPTRDNLDSLIEIFNECNDLTFQDAKKAPGKIGQRHKPLEVKVKALTKKGDKVKVFVGTENSGHNLSYGGIPAAIHAVQYFLRRELAGGDTLPYGMNWDMDGTCTVQEIMTAFRATWD